MPSVLNRSAKDDLAVLLSDQAGATFTSAQLSFSVPKVPASGESLANTKVRITVLDSVAGYTGNAIFYYNRLDLASFGMPWAILTPFTSTADQKLSTLLDKVQTMLGTVFTMDDLEDTVTVLDDNNVMTLLLKAKTNSLGWTGQFNLTLKPFPNIATAFSSDSMSAY